MDQVRAITFLSGVLLAGCTVSVNYNDSSFRCDRDQLCPDGLTCQADGFCGSDGTSDGGPDTDAPDKGSLFGPGEWTAMSDSPLAPRVWIDGLWTGSEFIIFGGALDLDYTSTNTGAAYNPGTDEWRETTIVDAPTARHSTMQVWTGTEAIYYGGAVGFSPTAGGGRYNPSEDRWAPISATGGPGERIYGTAIWIGDRMLIWGGWDNNTGHYNSGFLYDPTLDEWTPMSTDGAPSGRSFTSVVWTGQVAIVFGGCEGPMGACPDNLGDGGIYDPETDEWTPISTEGAPEPRSQHSAVWTGSEMLVFGGATGPNTSALLEDGYIYNLESDSWRPMSTSGAASPRADAATAWVGDKMLIWGSATGNNIGYLYDPRTDAWSLMSAIGAPEPRTRFARAAAADGRLFIWGGLLDSISGAVWTPSSSVD